VARADAPGVEAFAGRLREEQTAGNTVLAAALADAEAADLRGRLARLAAAAESRAQGDGA
jgi:hypothetical protein